MYKLKRKEFYLKIKKIKNFQIFKLLANSDPARIFSLLSFYESILDSKNFLFEEDIKIAVISGSDKEPELIFFKNAKIDFLNFEEKFISKENQLWDLSLDWSDEKYINFHNKYDLVLCEQVFEHIPDPKMALKNIKLILKNKGIAHISVPAINGLHGEPFYFTAGYDKRMLKYLANKIGGFKILDCESWGSKKAAKMYSTCDWTPLVSSGDFLDCLKISFKIFNLKNFLKYFYHKFKYNFNSIWHYKKREYPVISWILLEKK